jgi:hypothetical protein
MIEIFSYWIFIWFLLYYFELIKYNPILILILGYIFTLFEFIYLILNKISYYNGIKFFIINVIIKLIPIILIFRMNKYKLEINIRDIYVSIYLIFTYIIIMIIFNKNPLDYYKRMITTYLEINNKKEYKSVFSKLYDYIVYNIYLIYNYR